jgi:hypothetical protein
MAVKEEEETEEDGEDHDSDEDEEEDEIYFMASTLDLLLHIGTGIPNGRFRCALDLLTLDMEVMTIIYQRLDKHSDEIRVADKMVSLLFLLFEQPSNKSLFIELEGLDLLDVCIKLHKKNKAFKTKVTALMTL